MIRLTRPDPIAVERYRLDRRDAAPTFDRPGERPAGFGRTDAAVDLPSGPESFAAARDALRCWEVQSRAGVSIVPTNAPPRAGGTVAFSTRQLGLWITAACRITSVIDENDSFGFTYATLPDHPECGEESFTVIAFDETTTRFQIAATWRTAAIIARIGRPVSRVVQRRATQRYLDAMVAAVDLRLNA